MSPARALPGLACVLVLSMLAATGCKGGKSSGTGAGGGGCQSGQTMSADGSCFTVGVQGCADVFVEKDGLCRPAMAKCDPGEIPDIATGCVAVGIPGCAKEFMEADGLCHPSMSKCPAGTFAVPQQGCVSIDGAAGCGSGTWGDIPDGPMNVYVDASYSGGNGDGSKQAPFTTLAAAWAKVAIGGRIAIAAGNYPESLDVDRDVEIAGRCPSMVTISGHDVSSTLPTTVVVEAGHVTLRGFRVSSDGAGIYVGGTLGLTIDRVVVDGALDQGITAAAGPGMVTITNTLVQGTRSSGGTDGFGLRVHGAAKVTVKDSALVDNRSSGLIAFDTKTTVTANDVLIEGTGPEDGTMHFGEGAVALGGASMSLSAVAVIGNHLAGIEASQAGTQLTADGILIEGTVPQVSDMGLGVGIEAFGGGAITVKGSAVVQNHTAGGLAGDKGSSLTLENTLIADMLPDVNSKEFGRGLHVQDSAALHVQGGAIVRAREEGIVLVSDATGDVTGLLIEDTQPDQLDGQYGIGIFIATGPTLTMNSVTVSGGHVAGLVVAAATASVSQCLFTGIQGGTFTIINPDMTYDGVGDGALATLGSHLTLDQTRVEHCMRAGMLFDGSEGSISGSMSVDNHFGLVIDGTAQPMVDSASAFVDNPGGERIQDANLPVPGKPAALPQ